MKVRIKPYLDKEERTGSPKTKYTLVELVEDPDNAGVYVEGNVLSSGFNSEKQAEKYALHYKNNIRNAEFKDIEV